MALRYHSLPCGSSTRHAAIAARPVKMRLQRYTPTVANKRSNVQAANPSKTQRVIGIEGSKDLILWICTRSRHTCDKGRRAGLLAHCHTHKHRAVQPDVL